MLSENWTMQLLQESPHVSGLTIGIHGQNVDIFELPNINSYLWWFKICANLCYSITWSMLFAYWPSSIPNAVMIAARRLCNSTCPDSRLFALDAQLGLEVLHQQGEDSVDTAHSKGRHHNQNPQQIWSWEEFDWKVLNIFSWNLG